MIQGKDAMIGKAAELLEEDMCDDALSEEEFMDMWLDPRGR